MKEKNGNIFGVKNIIYGKGAQRDTLYIQRKNSRERERETEREKE